MPASEIEGYGPHFDHFRCHRIRKLYFNDFVNDSFKYILLSVTAVIVDVKWLTIIILLPPSNSLAWFALCQEALHKSGASRDGGRGAGDPSQKKVSASKELRKVLPLPCRGRLAPETPVRQ